MAKHKDQESAKPKGPIVDGYGMRSIGDGKWESYKVTGHAEPLGIKPESLNRATARLFDAIRKHATRWLRRGVA